MARREQLPSSCLESTPLTSETRQKMSVARVQANLEAICHLLTHKWSTDQFRMEFSGYMANHLLHGVVALYELGADQPQIENYAHAYCVQLEPVKPMSISPTSEQQQVPWHDNTSLTNALHWRGKRVGFDQLCALYSHEIETNGVDATLMQWLPPLVDGLAGALFHGIIQLGYAYRIGNPRSVAEGLAYLHHSYLPFSLHPQQQQKKDTIASQSQGSHEQCDNHQQQHHHQQHNNNNNNNNNTSRAITKDAVTKALEELRSDTLLRNHLHAKIKSPPLCDWSTSSLQKKLAAFSSHDTLGEVNALKRIADHLVPLIQHGALDGHVALDIALWLFTQLNCNDFVVVHVITSAWSLQQLEHLLVDPKDFEHGWQAWLLASFAGLLTREDTRVVVESSSQQQQLPSWESIVQQTLELQYTETHVYKIVQVAMLHATTSTAGTGVCRDQVERDLVCRQAALRVLSEPFYIV